MSTFWAERTSSLGHLDSRGLDSPAEDVATAAVHSMGVVRAALVHVVLLPKGWRHGVFAVRETYCTTTAREWTPLDTWVALYKGLKIEEQGDGISPAREGKESMSMMPFFLRSGQGHHQEYYSWKTLVQIPKLSGHPNAKKRRKICSCSRIPLCRIVDIVALCPSSPVFLWSPLVPVYCTQNLGMWCCVHLLLWSFQSGIWGVKNGHKSIVMAEMKVPKVWPHKKEVCVSYSIPFPTASAELMITRHGHWLIGCGDQTCTDVTLQCARTRTRLTKQV